MKNLFISVMLILGIGLSTAFSQAKVTVSTPYEVVDGKLKLYIQKGNELLKVTVKGKIIIIQKFNTNSLTETSKNEYEDFPKGFQYERLVELNNKFYLFYSLWDKPNQKEQLFCREIDFAKGTIYPNDIEIVKVDGKITPAGVSGTSIFNMMITKFEFQTNSSNTALLIKYRKKPLERNDSKNNDIIGFCVYTNDIKKPVWNREVTMPYTEALMDNLDYTVDKQGNAYLLAAVFDKESRNRDDSGFRLELFQLTPKSTKMNGVKIEFADKSINKIWIYESPKGYMVCSGFYGNDNKYSSDAKGIFAMKIDQSGRIYDKFTYDIPLEILNQFVSKREQKRNERKDNKGDAEFKDLVLRSISFQEDGSMIIFGEQHFINVYYSNNRTVYEYNYKDMLVTKIEANGKLAWMRKLPKRQLGTNGQGGMGYYSTSFEGKHYLLFLDNVKNLDIAEDEVPKEHRDGMGGFLTAYVIEDKTGAVKKISLFDSKDVEGQKIHQFNMDRIQQINGNEFILEAYKKGKEDILIKVNLKK